jgi:hypothetical protein
MYILQHRPIEESLREFENMKNGKYGGSDATLRMKMDMTSPNPNMWDQVSTIYMYVCIYCLLITRTICNYIRSWMFIYIYINMYIYIYTYIYLHIFIYMYIYTRLHIV